jgi:hypothetical protein
MAKQETGAAFTLGYMNSWLQERRRTVYVDDMANLLVGPVFRHPGYKDGAPFQMTYDEVAEAYQEHLGGKAFWKVIALRDEARFGIATPRVSKWFHEAGFSVTFGKKTRARARAQKVKRQGVDEEEMLERPVTKCPRLAEE